MQNKQTNTLINAALFILMGVLLCIFRSQVLGWAMTIIGIALIGIGIWQIVKKAIPVGVILIVLGAVIIAGGWLFLQILMLIAGASLMVNGILKLLKSLKPTNTFAIIASIVTIVMGILLFVSTFTWDIVDILLIIAGIILIADGVLMLVGMIKEK